MNDDNPLIVSLLRHIRIKSRFAVGTLPLESISVYLFSSSEIPEAPHWGLRDR